MDQRIVEQVLAAVELVPPGRVVSYGDLAELVGIDPRQVGQIMARCGGDVPWWRVCNSYGDPPAGLRAEVLDRWLDEGITIKSNGLGCRIVNYRADLVALAEQWDARP